MDYSAHGLMTDSEGYVTSVPRMRKLIHDIKYNLKFKEEFVKINALSGVSTMNNTQTQNYFTQYCSTVKIK